MSEIGKTTPGPCRVPSKTPRIKSEFALLDVTSGRKALAKLMPPGSQSLPKEQRIPVTIRGFISHRHGDDDGISIEFGVDVSEIELGSK
jgi:hypothetical protein